MLQRGDVVTSVDGEKVVGAAGLTRRIAAARLGEVVKLDVLRNGLSRDASLRVVRRSEAPQGQSRLARGEMGGVGAAKRVRPMRTLDA